MGDLTSLNEWILNPEDGVFSFLTAQLVDSGLSLSSVRPNGLSLSLGLAP